MGFKMKRSDTNKFLSGSKMENHRVQSAKTLVMKDFLSFHGCEDMVLWRFQMLLLKTSENKMVMFIIALSLDGIFRRIGKSI